MPEDPTPPAVPLPAANPSATHPQASASAKPAPTPPPPPTLEAIVAEIRRLYAQSEELERQRAYLLARRQALEAALAERLRDELGADLAAEVGATLIPPVATPAAPEAASPDPGTTFESRSLGATTFDSAAPAPSAPAAPPTVPTPPSAPRLIVRGVNYYPSQRGWWRMWCDWHPDEIGSELDLAKGLGVNTIRTFLPFSVLEGRPIPDDTGHLCPGDPNTVLDRVDQFLALTNARGMKVILGLFDEYPVLPELINNPLTAMNHLDRVLNYVTNHGRGVRLGDDPRILMWDLVNELDDSVKVTPGSDPPRPLFIQPMFAADPIKYYPTPKGDPAWPWVHEGLIWLKLIYNHVYYQSTQQITFGVLNPFSAVELVKIFPDARHVPQYHEYLPYGGDPVAYNLAVDERMRIIWIRTGRRTLIGELGPPSKLSLNGLTWTENLQRDAISVILRAAARNADKIMGTCIWTLTDWNFSGTQENDEKYRGLFRADDLSPKPAALVVRSIYQQMA